MDDAKAGAEDTYSVTISKKRGSKRFSSERYPGFRYSGTEYKPRWSRKGVTAEGLEAVRRLAKEDKLVVQAVPTQYTRSSDYRKRFLAENPGPWRCRYCHKRLVEETMTVDHIVPVARAASSGPARWALEKMGADSVNDTANLAPACPSCNGRKSSKGGLWIARGMLGDKGWYWALVWIARALGLVALGALVWVFVKANPLLEELLSRVVN